MAGARDIRAKNARNAATARAGKSIVRPSTAEKNARKPPISAGLVFLLLFVVVGGVVFELIRYFIPDPPMTRK